MSRMNSLLLRAVVVCVSVVATATKLYGLNYTAIVLHPAGFATSRSAGASAGNQVGSAISDAINGKRHAFLWNDSAASAIDLNPTGYAVSTANGAWGNYQVGSGFTETAWYQYHALMWQGTAASVVDLNPPNTLGSFANAISGTDVVGALDFGNYHAALWHGSAANVVDLHPAGFADSYATGVSGTKQVGLASYYSNCDTGCTETRHAILWSGNAASAVDLNPQGFVFSIAASVSGDVQVGYGMKPEFNGNDHAILWRGSAASAVDLHPAGFDFSQAHGVAGTRVVGYGYGPTTSNESHALVWNGTPQSVVDLQPFLAAVNPTLRNSEAVGIADDGTIVGYATNGESIQNGNVITPKQFAVLWKPNPDFNQNDAVDAADYVAWRNGLGTSYAQSDYDLWRGHFGPTAGSGASLITAIPEPASAILFLTGSLAIRSHRHMLMS